MEDFLMKCIFGLALLEILVLSGLFVYESILLIMSIPALIKCFFKKN